MRTLTLPTLYATALAATGLLTAGHASAAAGCVACDQGADQCDSVAPALDRVRHQLNAPAEKQ